MSPSEIISFLLIGAAVIVAIVVFWFIFRKRIKFAIALTAVLVIGYIGYFIYYPTLKVNTHAKRYEQVMEYLTEKYPDKEYSVSPEHYEKGYSVGEFNVNDVETPTMGVTLRVDRKGQVTQILTWSNLGYPAQQELWRKIEFFYGETYTLDKDIADVTKEDEWINGELTAFALTIDEMPAIAFYNYSKASFSLLGLELGEREGFVVLEEDGYLFIYVDKRYERETITGILENGKEFMLNIDQKKGRLIVEKQQ
ncbi:hypothetical protein [Sporosarcina sp. FSL K6-2383]|uniref:hypothetical protein n=1 Tax=Sporosarcina sp. FSL K6-2383 TaxID=2921556 RepID=UPI00315AA44B